MADHAKPILTDNYTDVLSQIRGRFEDQAKGFDPANTTATNISTGTIRWNSAENKDQKWTGTAWVDKSSNYVFNGITLSGGTANGVAYLNGSKVLTTGSALTFDGTNLGVGTAPVALASQAAITIRGASISRVDMQGAAGAGGGGVLGSASVFKLQANYAIPLILDAGTTSYTVFTIGDSEQMRLTSTGLGIGTSSPRGLLDLNTTRGVKAYFGTAGTFGETQNTAGDYVANNLFVSAESAGAMTYTKTTGDNGNAIIQDFSRGITFYTGVTGASTTTGTLNTFERMRLDASGNLGLGVIPSAWGNGVSMQGSGWALSTTLGTDCGAYYVNARQTGYAGIGSSCVYRTTAPAGAYGIESATHKWYTAPSGTAGSTISFTQAMTLNANGNLLVGNTNGTSRITASGVIESTTGGFKFPDGTTQTTAAVDPATAAVGAIGTMAMCKYTGTGSVSFGGTKNASELQYSDVTGSIVSASVDGNTWRCLGRCSDAGNAQRVTIWVRVS